jgi:ankyrin repeat protein
MLCSVVREIVEAGADVRAVDQKKCTPLHRAAEYNPSADVIKALVDKGADIEARDNYQWTPLHRAAWLNPGKVKILIECGANVNVLTSGQGSPLFFAALKNNREAVIELCKAGAKPQLGRNPLDDKSVSYEMKTLIRENCLSL